MTPLSGITTAITRSTSFLAFLQCGACVCDVSVSSSGYPGKDWKAYVRRQVKLSVNLRTHLGNLLLYTLFFPTTLTLSNIRYSN
ncbi:hypothetical protein E2C01_077785 [Portunus trituberculatus]|uniref:Uncharacterized protein n=1 Tax=Portunus trituberculatus TaxID=210409 RepID=A0A5B7ISE0_PORTR|nr:hypothetical protein [Portunus trituberculatus]